MSDAKRRILIVDDEDDLVVVLRLGLEHAGYEVSSAADGEEGLRRVHAAAPDLVVLDLMLPKVDGYKVCRALKFDERFRQIPVVILSARSGEQDRQLARSVGADVFVSKPYEMTDLLGKIDGLLSRRGRRAA
jgi:DNA-binding response OmpR family regulator